MIGYFAQRIKARRISLNLSQKELAFMAGITAAHLSRIESAVTNPRESTIWKIADALGLSITGLANTEL